MGRGRARGRRGPHLLAAGLILPASLAAPALAQPLTPGRPAAPGAAEASGKAAAEVTALVVTASGRPGAGAVGDMAPELTFDEAQIRALGASSVSELINLLALQIAGRGARGGPPVTLVNGAPVSSLFEVQDLPPEAIRRLEVLPEEAALRFGYRADQLVLNLVLQPSLQAGTVQTDGRASTAGHGESLSGDIDLIDLDDLNRLQLDLKAARSWPISESARGLAGGSPFRTLAPLSEQTSANLVLGRPSGGGVAVAANGRFEADRTEVWLGPAAGGDAPLRQRVQTSRAHLGLSAQGALAGWRWSALANAERSLVHSVTDVELGEPERNRSAVTSADLQATVVGQPARLPAGDLVTSLTAGVQGTRIESRSQFGGFERSADLSRRIAVVQANVEAPIARRGSAAGELSANLTFAASQVSDVGGVTRWRAGLNWSPARALRVSIAESLETNPPGIEDLGDPTVISEGVRVFDAVRGETALVTRREGGDPTLSPEKRRQLRAGFTFKPFEAQGLTLRADYIATVTRGAIVSPTAATAELEAALPGRFVRDASGRLVAIDVRPFNLARRDAEELRLGLSYSGSLAGGSFQLAALETERLKDEVQMAAGGPRLDLLSGQGLAAGLPRRQAEVLAAFSRRGRGLRLTGRWQGGARVAGGTAGEALAFSSLALVSVHLFAALGTPGGPDWLRGARVALTIDNLADARLKVRNGRGETPFSYQPAVTDPLGRTVRLSLRKSLP